MNSNEKKFLLAVDGSNHSLETVRYVSKILPSQQIKVVLFHVTKKIDKAFWGMGIEPSFGIRIAEIRAWEFEQKKAINEFMNNARQILLDAGFAQESVSLDIHELKVGVARDIAIESQRGYSAVAVGRRGVSKLKDLLLGSVANKLIEKSAHVPLWVVGGKPEPGRILLASDASEGAMKAVDHVGSMLGGSNFEVTLFNVIRNIDIFQMGDDFFIPRDMEKLFEQKERQWIEASKNEMESVFKEARNHLVNAGIDPLHVTTKFIKEVGSRAGAIVEEARKGGYGTIVVGRRGLSKVEEFFMGRVSNKVIQLARDLAVWVVS